LGKRIRPKPYPSPETPTVVQGGFRAHLEDSPHRCCGFPLGGHRPHHGCTAHRTSAAPAEAADIRRGVYMLPAMVLISAPARVAGPRAENPRPGSFQKRCTAGVSPGLGWPHASWVRRCTAQATGPTAGPLPEERGRNKGWSRGPWTYLYPKALKEVAVRAAPARWVPAVMAPSCVCSGIYLGREPPRGV